MIKKGFTLIELLVVIALIGLLASIGLVSYTGSQKQGRDVRRKSDLKQYQLSLENFANKNNGLYPQRPTTLDLSLSSNVLCSDLSMTNCPTDPKESQDPTFVYHYQSNGTLSDGTAAATNYVLWAKLENISNTYFVICSNGKTSQATTGVPPSGGNCPL